MSPDSYLTEQGFKKIKLELEELKEKSKRIAEQIREARENGNIEDNPMYDSYIEEQGYAEGKISELEEILGSSEVVTVSDSIDGIVGVGSTVHVKYNGIEDMLILVGSAEADPLQKRISIESPVGKALLGAKPGDTIIVDTPQIRMEYYIKAIK